MNKLHQVQAVLQQFPSVREWFDHAHDVAPACFTEANVMDYSAEGLGEVADMILAAPAHWKLHGAA